MLKISRMSRIDLEGMYIIHKISRVIFIQGERYKVQVEGVYKSIVKNKVQRSNLSCTL